MSTTAYRLRVNSGLLTSRLQRCLLLRDVDDLLGKEETVPAVSSTDYLAQLATWLDEICMDMGSSNRREMAKLQRIIDDLLYLYSNYEIKKKQPKSFELTDERHQKS